MGLGDIFFLFFIFVIVVEAVCKGFFDGVVIKSDRFASFNAQCLVVLSGKHGAVKFGSGLQVMDDFFELV